MGFAVVHMQKFKAGGVRGIQSHNNREHPPKTNPDIDTSRTEQNYDLIYSDNYSRSVKVAIENFAPETKTVRKDAVVYCSFLVTSDEKTMKAMTPEQQKAFFEDSVMWFADRYGAENIVNATVHMDETTPHMHVGVVPITGERLAAKTLFDRKELTAIQTDFAKQVGERYGLERGKEGSERTHLSEQRFKVEAAKKELETVKGKISEVASEAQNIDVEVRKSAERVISLQEREKALQGQIRALEGQIQNGKELKINEICAIQPQRTFTGALKGVSVEDIENLKRTAIMVVKATEDVKSLSQENSRLSRKCETLEKQQPSMADKMKDFKEKSRLLEIEKAFKRLPEDEQKRLLTPIRTQERGRER